MKKSRFTESQIVAIPKEGEAGVPVAQLTRKHGISAATHYHWKSKYAGPEWRSSSGCVSWKPRTASSSGCMRTWRWRPRRSRRF